MMRSGSNADGAEMKPITVIKQTKLTRLVPSDFRSLWICLSLSVS
jgi:hypothetical protein